MQSQKVNSSIPTIAQPQVLSMLDEYANRFVQLLEKFIEWPLSQAYLEQSILLENRQSIRRNPLNKFRTLLLITRLLRHATRDGSSFFRGLRFRYFGF
ncbi:hypothetical protein BBD42_02860 [Paenibacillus sp. BIHB 4019]|uniref:Uncharacterized protein n=1 Tax=Paenibacillus sp. BIHB 4019 TaxID=1870819 RepID=A0A1B2DCT6_9BACL|nr:hypothetical protein BBD42_02860 [Paenibacillus sp. BIHB 4019]